MIARLVAITLAAAVALLAACTSGDSSPSVEPSPTPPAPVAAATLALAEGCTLFDQGQFDPLVVPDEPASIQLGTSRCGREALEGVASLLVEWAPRGLDGPTVSTVLTPATRPGWWQGTASFPERGSWHTGPPVGLFIDVFAADPGLSEPSLDLPIGGTQQTVAVLNGAANEVLRSFPADLNGIGLLRDPDRAVFVQAREGGRWLVTADIASGEIEPLFEVGPFASIASAPDGRAVAVEWGTAVSGVRQLRIVTASGLVTAIDDGSISHISLTWAPDSSALLASGDSLWVLEPDGGVLLQRPEPGRISAQPQWSPDSRYVLLQPRGGRARLMRINIASLDEEILLDHDTTVAVREVVIAPDGERVAVLWEPSGGETLHLSVAAIDGLATAHLEHFVVARFDHSDDPLDPDPLNWSLDGLSWSPDGQLLAILNVGLPKRYGDASPRTTIAIVDATSGEVRVVAETPDFYAGSLPHSRVWTADSTTLFALRFNCSGCEPSSSSVDVIDVAAGHVVRRFEGAGFVGMAADRMAALLSTREGLLRVDGRGGRELLVPSPGGVYFGPQAVSLTRDSGTPLVVVRLGITRGQQVFAARADGSDVAALAVFDLEEQVAALLDGDAAVIRGRGDWERRDLATGTAAPYRASSDAPEKFEFVPSPSGSLAIDRDAEGFAVLDARDPNADAIVAYREYPGGAAGRPAWSPDERRVAFGDGYTIGVFDLESGVGHTFELDSLGLGLHSDDPLHRLEAITWTPGGALEFATRGALWRLDVDAGTAAKVADAPRPGGFTPGAVLAYSPDGRTLAAATQFGVFALGEDGAWRELSVLGIVSFDGALRWAPDSSAVAFGAEAAHVPEGIIVAPLDGSGAYRLVTQGAVRLLDWLADGRIVWVSSTGGV